MRVECVKLYKIRLQLKAPFTTSNGEIYSKNHILVEVLSDNASGWGEAPALSDLNYITEDDQTILDTLSTNCIPLVLKRNFDHPSDIWKALSVIDGNNMAKASIEMACWDLYAKEKQVPLYKALGGTRREVLSGGVIGVGELPILEEKIELLKVKKLHRIKLKINRSTSASDLISIKEKFPDIKLSIDCNGCFDISDMTALKSLDLVNFCMIEQPFSADDLSNTAKLKELIKTPICLDESLRSLTDLSSIISTRCCNIVSIKPPCVGGHTISKLLSDVAAKAGLEMYCGGMFETGIGRAHNLALSTLNNFNLPAEISNHGTYYSDDIIEEVLSVNRTGAYNVTDRIGIGVTPCMKTISGLLISKREFN